MRRNEVWWAELPKPMGPRPVVLLSRDKVIQVRSYVTIALITTRMRDLPVEVRLDQEDGLAKACVVNCDTITTVKKSSLVRRLATLTSERVSEVDNAIRFALDLR